MKPLFAKLSAMVVTICAIGLLAVSIAQAAPDFMWCNEMSDMLHSFQASYPTSNFGPYFLKEASLREATARGDEAALRAGITNVIKMDRTENFDVVADVKLDLN